MEEVKDKKKQTGKGKYFIWGGIGVVVLFIIFAIIGTPSADSVFNDMKQTMLQTKTVQLNQKYSGGSGANSVEFNSEATLDMTSRVKLLAKGEFTMSLVSSGTPVKMKANFVTIGDENYIKYDSISSSDPTLSASFSAINTQMSGKWIKVRDTDKFASFASIPVDSFSDVLPTPMANLNDSQIKNVMKLLDDEKTYTIEESSKVELANVPTYKYVLSYNEDQYKKVAEAINDYVGYLKVDDSKDSKITSLTIWVNISTKQIMKLEVEGTSKLGDTSGTILFSNYNEETSITKPSDYFIESELLKD